MNKKTKLLLWILLAVIIFVTIYVVYSALSADYAPDNLAQTNTTQNQSSESNYTAPDFSVTDSNGEFVKLSDYFGKPIVLNLWASWCSPCKLEMPYFENSFKEEKDVQFLMVNMTAGDSIESAKAFIEEQGYTFPVLFDVNGEAAAAYGATSLPMTIFIDKNGEYVTHAVGALSQENLDYGISLIK